MAIATANYRVYGKTTMGVQIELTAKLELNQSGAFKYGNGTCVTFKLGDNHEQYYDTRYDTSLRRDGSNFESWGLEFLREYCDKGLTIEVVK